MLFRCQPGFEDLLVGELRAAGLATTDRGGGWALTAPAHGPAPELCFAHALHLAPTELGGDSVNVLATRLLEHFLNSARDERFDAPGPASSRPPPASTGWAAGLMPSRPLSTNC